MGTKAAFFQKQKISYFSFLVAFVLTWTLTVQVDAAPLNSKTISKKSLSRKLSNRSAISLKNNPNIGAIESVTRQVEVKKSNATKWDKAKNQSQLQKDDQIKTGSRSLARVKLSDGSKILLLQNSQAEVENLSTVEKTIKLLKGRVRAIVSKIKGGNNFKIKTPIGVASVRGTDFEVEITDDGKSMQVDVNEGSVVVAKLGDLSNEVMVNGGESIKFGIEGQMGDPVKSTGVQQIIDKEAVQSEVMNTQVKDNLIAMAAEELKTADYQEAKTFMDVNGLRVRTEEYITRPASDQFKLVVLNERESRFDYFTYKGTFNKSLPEDLSLALRDLNGKIGGTAPEYYLTAYEKIRSNTIDSLTDEASGGHLVQITNDGNTYTLTDPTVTSNTRDIDAAELLSDGNYKVYNPDTDTFSLVTPANLESAKKVSVQDPTTSEYRNLTSADTLWKNSFDNYTLKANSSIKTQYEPSTVGQHILAQDLDGTFNYAPVTAASEYPSGSDTLYSRNTLYYADGKYLRFDNYIINDEGKIATRDDFSGLSNGADYRNELMKWNFETVITATEFSGRKIDLCITPKVLIESGLLK
ncbi:MAG: FecR domain-containing protein [Elusimicrobiota bacterium]